MTEKTIFSIRSAVSITSVNGLANCCWKHAHGGSLRVPTEELFANSWISYPACYVGDEQNSKEVISQVEGMEAHVLARALAA
jgi:hypothetical protein